MDRVSLGKILVLLNGSVFVIAMEQQHLCLLGTGTAEQERK